MMMSIWKKHKNAFIGIAVFVLLLALFICLFVDIWHIDSPDGKYRVFGYLIDQGGWGYSGRFYLRENRPFTKWHLLGYGPCICEWLTNDSFLIYEYIEDTNQYRETVYDVKDFFQ